MHIYHIKIFLQLGTEAKKSGEINTRFKNLRKKESKIASNYCVYLDKCGDILKLLLMISNM